MPYKLVVPGGDFTPYTTFPILFRILKDPTTFGINIPFLPDLINTFLTRHLTSRNLLLHIPYFS